QNLRLGERIATGQGLSSLAFDVVCGTLLGDGSINGNSSYLQFAHSIRQKEYAEFKEQLLAELSPKLTELSVAAVVGGETKYPAVHVRTPAHRVLRTIRKDFYRPQKVVPPWI